MFKIRKAPANLLRAYYSTKLPKPKVCVVGAGPAGFYASQHLVKNIPSVEVDIIDKLPVPFGLVRFGVAPDHPEVKNVINTFTKTAEHPSVRFIGNVNLGRDVSLAELQEAYDVVLLSYGADENRQLNIPGEDLKNVISARNIVGWYNGTPWDADLEIDLSGPTVAVIGQGNVAIDIARILLTPVDLLRHTDITQHALDTLATSQIREVHLIGRRGPLQAAYTIKELREMLKLPSCATSLNHADFFGVDSLLPTLARPRKRITELMLKALAESNSKSQSKLFKPVFYKSPLAIRGDSSSHVASLELGVNQLDKTDSDFAKHRAVLTETRELLDCQLLVPSIGYKSVQVDETLPFDERLGVARNKHGRIGENLFASGWLASGPTGVILTTMTSAFGTAEYIAETLKARDLSAVKNKPGFELLAGVLKQRNVQSVSWRGWLKIDRYEIEQGARVGKPREKIVDLGKMLEIAS